MAAGAAAGAWVLVLSLWGVVVGGQNITARIGEPLVLKCKGALKKPPQQLEWKLNTGRTEAWKVLSPQGGSWDSVARILPNGSLLLPSVGIQDEGTFRCRTTNRNGKETKSNYRVRVYQIPGKPEIMDPASELRAGIPSKIHWMKDGMRLALPPSPVLLLPEVGPQDEGIYSCVVTQPNHGPRESPPVSISLETGEEELTPGPVGGSGLGTLALALGILGGLSVAALLVGIILWRRRQRQGEERKVPENQEDEEERTELNQSEEPEATEGGVGGS